MILGWTFILLYIGIILGTIIEYYRYEPKPTFLKYVAKAIDHIPTTIIIIVQILFAISTFFIVLTAIYVASILVFKNCIAIHLKLKPTTFSNYSSAMVTGLTIIVSIALTYFKISFDSKKEISKDRDSSRPYFALGPNAPSCLSIHLVSLQNLLVQRAKVYIRNQTTKSKKWHSISVGHMLSNSSNSTDIDVPTKELGKDWIDNFDCIISCKTVRGEHIVFTYAEGINGAHMIIDNEDLKNLQKEQIKFYGYDNPDIKSIITLLDSTKYVVKDDIKKAPTR
ncbi:hypothetical protein [Levilactobacillus brevis]|uniref:hypothetical protein n=1 Tax=Levilactobacillus brevis TaxID=1580 RepID=UPI00226FA0E0|nr:hypothetical protein [Levilactobacillus brevis]